MVVCKCMCVYVQYMRERKPTGWTKEKQPIQTDLSTKDLQYACDIRFLYSPMDIFLLLAVFSLYW